jgi:hypothetical protein
MSLVAFARAGGTPYGALAAWFRRKSVSTSLQKLRLVANLLNISEQQAIEEAGGATAEERMHELGSAKPVRFPRRGTKRHRETVKKRSQTLKGTSRPLELVERIQASRIRSGAAERATAALATASRSNAGRSISSLVVFLRSHPSPSVDELRRQAKESSGRLQICATEILEHWASVLQQHGIRRPPGRHADADRCTQLRGLMSQRGRTGRGRLPRGFWPESGTAMDLNYDVLRQWSIDHRVECGALEAALGTKT